jgi:hypothetical protein
MKKILFIWALSMSILAWHNHNAYVGIYNKLVEKQDACNISDVAASKYREIKNWIYKE